MVYKLNNELISKFTLYIYVVYNTCQLPVIILTNCNKCKRNYVYHFNLQFVVSFLISQYIYFCTLFFMIIEMLSIWYTLLDYNPIGYYLILLIMLYDHTTTVYPVLQVTLCATVTLTSAKKRFSYTSSYYRENGDLLYQLKRKGIVTVTTSYCVMVM